MKHETFLIASGYRRRPTWMQPARRRFATQATVLMVLAVLFPLVAACTADGQSSASQTPTAQPPPTESASQSTPPSTTDQVTPAAAATATLDATPVTVAPGASPAAVSPSASASPAAVAPAASPAAIAPAASPVAVAPAASPVAQSQANPQASFRPNPAELVYEQNQKSVVSVISRAAVPTQRGPMDRSTGMGTGFVLDDQGHIVTNNHVIEQAEQLTVTFPDDGRTVVPARLIGRDPDNDLAVIKVDPRAVTDDNTAVADLLDPVTLGSMDSVRIGQDAIAIGSPLGLQQSVTAGIVSAVRPPTDTPSEALELLGGAIQTDAAINPGNSGGPLFNARGEVIGVNTAILSQSGGNIGVGFAIPIDVVKRIVPELIEYGCYRHPLIGVTTVPLALLGQATKRDLGLPTEQAGLLVQEVTAGAEAAGLRAGGQVLNLGGTPLRVGGDIIVAVDGQSVTSGGDLRAYIENSKRPGDTLSLTVLRNDQRQDVQVQLTEKPSEVCPT